MNAGQTLFPAALPMCHPWQCFWLAALPSAFPPATLSLFSELGCGPPNRHLTGSRRGPLIAGSPSWQGLLLASPYPAGVPNASSILSGRCECVCHIIPIWLAAWKDHSSLVLPQGILPHWWLTICLLTCPSLTLFKLNRWGVGSLERSWVSESWPQVVSVPSTMS